MNVFDRKLAAAFGSLTKTTLSTHDQEKSRRVLEDIKGRIGDVTLKHALESSSHALRSWREKSNSLSGLDSLKLIDALNAAAMPATSEVVFLAFLEVFKSLDLELLLPAFATVKTIDAWAKASVTPKKTLQEKFLANPEPVYSTAGCDWCLKKIDPRKADSFNGFALSRKPRPNYLPQWNELLSVVIQKDKKMRLLQTVLEQHSENSEHIQTLAELVSGDKKLLRPVVDFLPSLLQQKSISKQSIDFTKLLISQLLLAPTDQRPFISAAIARLGTGILMQGTNPNAAPVMSAIAGAMSQIKFTTFDEAIKRETWIFEPLQSAAERMDENQHLTLTGARHLIAAFEKARKGVGAYDVLSMTAKNLGITGVGNKGEKVAYNPLHHEDIQGGLSPGETVEIVEPGWKFRSSILLRATVIKPPK